ncbi:hypothetical protein [Aestuariispira insulae]|uniref:Uncharacterized protein n=1 Tax=Aestuariispira insulae TaxID=1461337 RepID=A0A3D9HWR5_9PROT|nr:hypothetical protein [Aestuariispira insulae]RED53927.1 hypothetical protein DFP90_101726 [Aestuariispira insulae]
MEQRPFARLKNALSPINASTANDNDDPDGTRLQRVTTNLEQAQRQLQKNLADYRATLKDLKKAMAGLGAGVTVYQEKLVSLKQGIDGFGGRSRHLARAMEDALQSCPKG